MIKNLVNFKDERAFCDYKIIVPGQPVRIPYVDCVIGEVIDDVINYVIHYIMLTSYFQPIHVHKLVLAAASTYFKRVLESGMQEAISGEIHMKEISYETVQILVNFSYGQVIIYSL